MKYLKLLVGIFFMVMSQASSAASCGPGNEVFDRFQISGEQIQSGDTLVLTIGGYSVTYTVNAASSAASEWPKYLAIEVNNNLPDNLVEAGVPWQGYTPVSSDTDNVLDLKFDNTNVSLTKNGNDYSSQLVSQTLPPTTYSGSRYISGWQKNYISSRVLTFFTFSNITNTDVTVKVYLYDQFGNAYDESSEPGTHFNIVAPSPMVGDPVSSQGAVVPARGTGSFYIASGGSARFGHGVIQWTSSTCLESALVGQITRHIGGSSYAGSSQMHINSGNPF